MSNALLTRPSTGTTVLIPRVNLLPQEIADAANFRRLQIKLGAAVAASLGVVGLLFVAASGQVSSAQEGLDTATASTQALQQQVTALAEVPQVYGQVAAAESQLSTAMGDEVRWSFYLTDLSLTIPNDVGLTSMSVKQTRTAAAPAAGAPSQPAAGATSVLGTPGIATVTFEGQAATQDDVAAFLDALAKQKSYVDPYFTNASKTDDADSGQEVVTFSATTTVTDQAKSGRYTNQAG
jgi:Tfp pilus assembly protein PilN